MKFVGKKPVVCILAVLVVCLLTACAEGHVKTYRYSKQDDILDEYLIKTEYYEDKLIVHFSEDALSEVEDVNCFDSEDEWVEDRAEFEFEDDVLTIYSENATKITAIDVYEHSERYFSIRYLDSNQYAMLLYTWVSEMGMEPTGDMDAYLTQEEKDTIEENNAKWAATIAEKFALVSGVWEDEEQTIRIEVKETDRRIVEIYEKDGTTWTLARTIPVDSLWVYDEEDEADEEPIEGYFVEGIGLSYMHSFMLYNEMTEMEWSEQSEHRLYKIQ